MEPYKFCDLNGLATFLAGLDSIYTSKEQVKEILQLLAATDPYILEIDYDNTLAFDTTELIV